MPAILVVSPDLGRQRALIPALYICPKDVCGLTPACTRVSPTLAGQKGPWCVDSGWLLMALFNLLVGEAPIIACPDPSREPPPLV